MKSTFLKRIKKGWKAFCHPQRPILFDEIRPVPIVTRHIDTIPVAAMYRAPNGHCISEEFVKRQLCHSLAEFIMKNIPLDIKVDKEQYATVYSVRLRFVPDHISD